MAHKRKSIEQLPSKFLTDYKKCKGLEKKILIYHFCPSALYSYFGYGIFLLLTEPNQMVVASAAITKPEKGIIIISPRSSEGKKNKELSHYKP